MSLKGIPFSSIFPAQAVFACRGPGDPGTLLPEESALLGGPVAPERRRDFTLGRVCAREALAGLRPEWSRFPVLRQGDRLPRWPAGVAGAIAHTGGWAAAVAAWSPPFLGLGVDMERLRPVSDRLRRRILRPEELEANAALHDAQEREWDFMLRFSVKESLFKALYPRGGVYLGFQAATVLPPRGAWAADQGALRWRLHQGCGPEFPPGLEGVGAFQRRGEWILTGAWVLAAAG